MIAKTETLALNAKIIVGMEVHATNANGQAMQDIGALWRRFTEEQVVGKIQHKVSDNIFCLYTDYETDHTGFYTAIIGCEVSEVEGNEGLSIVHIPASKYQVHQLSGKFPDKVYAAWQQIWQSSEDRLYSVDYDLYKPGVNSFEEMEVEIFVAVK